MPMVPPKKEQERVRKEVEMLEVDALELMSEEQQHWGGMREEEREGGDRQREGGAGSWEKQMRQKVESWPEEESARDEVETEGT